MQKIGFCERYMLTTAVLKRFKTNTRRLEKALEHVVAEYEKQHGEPFEIITQYWDEKRKKVCCLTKQGIIHVSTHYKLNEVVAVAQAYKDIFHPLDWVNREIYENEKGWTNKLFVHADLMPHQIKITGVRIERLQDINDAGYRKEGIEYSHYERNWFYTNDKNVEFHSSCPRKAFASLINRHGVGRKGLWESNPWVVVYKFKLVK